MCSSVHVCVCLFGVPVTRSALTAPAAHRSAPSKSQVRCFVNEKPNHWQAACDLGIETGALVGESTGALCMFFPHTLRLTVTSRRFLDTLTSDKLPITSLMCWSLTHHVPITLLLSLLCGSDVRCQGNDFRKKGGSPVTSSLIWLLYLITFQMTNETLLPVGY